LATLAQAAAIKTDYSLARFALNESIKISSKNTIQYKLDRVNELTIERPLLFEDSRHSGVVRSSSLHVVFNEPINTAFARGHPVRKSHRDNVKLMILQKS